MTELYEKSLSKLELGQVLEMLSQCAGSEGGKAVTVCPNQSARSSTET